jgi:tRNA dimethylallyltransferase
VTERKVILIFGPTASGKSETALKIASKINSVIINADSLQVYKDLKILTSRPTINDEEVIPHRLYGHIKGDFQYTVANWLNDVSLEIESIFFQNLVPIIVGGTGLYFKSLLNGLASIPDIKKEIKDSTDDLVNKFGLEYLKRELVKKSPTSKIKNNDPNRIIRAYNILTQTGKTIEEWHSNTKPNIDNVSYQKLLINPDRKLLYKNAEDRFDIMINNGGIEEVEELNLRKYGLNNSVMKAIGVREISDFIAGKTSLEDCTSLAKQKSRNYIKRQQTWINSNNITWNDSYEKLMKSI